LLQANPHGASVGPRLACYKFDVGRSSARVRVEVADANELVLSMGASTSNGRALSLAGDVQRFAPSSWMWTHLLSLVADAPSPRDASALLVHLERTPAVEMQRRLVGYYTSWFRDLTPPDVIDRALAGDAAAVRAFLRTSMPEDRAWHDSLRERLEDGPRRTKQTLIALLDAWNQTVFAPVARETMREVRRAVRTAGRGTASETLRGYIGYVPATNAASIVIIPSVALGEDTHEFDHLRTLFFCVPVHPRAARRPSELSALIGVLADDSRAAIVSELAREDLTAQELADRVGLGLSTTLHHLAALRRAEFVARGGRRRAYGLRRAPIRRLRAIIDELGVTDGD
jgi:DNA-binding transcriptional ArsR family regulator